MRHLSGMAETRRAFAPYRTTHYRFTFFLRSCFVAVICQQRLALNRDISISYHCVEPSRTYLRVPYDIWRFYNCNIDFCAVSLHHDDVTLQVNQQYLVNLYVDDLPLYGPLGAIDKDENGNKELKIYVGQK